MQTKNLSNPDVDDKHPDYLKSPKETEDFGGHANEPYTQENYPNLGNQSQTGAATNNAELDKDPNSDEDGSVFDTDD